MWVQLGRESVLSGVSVGVSRGMDRNGEGVEMEKIDGTVVGADVIVCNRYCIQEGYHLKVEWSSRWTRLR